MKKISTLLFTFISLFIFTVPASADTGSTINVIDYTGTAKSISVYDETPLEGTKLSPFGHSSYAFSKTCHDWQGCPYEIRGIINGHPFLVYRQYFTNWNNDAVYSGWLYW